MAFLPEDVRSQQRVLGIALLLGAATLFFPYVQAPREEEAIALDQRIRQLERRNRAVRAGTDDLARTRAKLARTERLLAVLQQRIPRDADVADVYQELAERSEGLGLELVSVDPSREERPEGAYYRRLRWEVTLEGRYHELGAFLAQVASLPRLVHPSVHTIEGLGRAADGRYPVRADVVLETFVLDEEEGAPAVPLAGRDAPEEPTGSSLLPYEREPFAYPVGDRPNPFRPAATTGRVGPRFEDLRLSGILYGPAMGSVAVLRDGTTGRIHRLREGDRVGSGRLVELRSAEAHFVVTGPAGSRRVLLRVDSDRRPGGRR